MRTATSTTAINLSEVLLICCVSNCCWCWFIWWSKIAYRLEPSVLFHMLQFLVLVFFTFLHVLLCREQLHHASVSVSKYSNFIWSIYKKFKDDTYKKMSKKAVSFCVCCFKRILFSWYIFPLTVLFFIKNKSLLLSSFQFPKGWKFEKKTIERVQKRSLEWNMKYWNQRLT